LHSGMLTAFNNYWWFEPVLVLHTLSLKAE
jgi:hypothetical protein